MTELLIRAATPEEGPEWDAYVRAHAEGSFFHLVGWRRVAQRVFRHRLRDLAAWRGDRLVGVLPLMEGPALPRGRVLLSVPYGVYGGPLGDDPEVEAALVGHATELGRVLGVRRLELRCRKQPAWIGVEGVPDTATSDLYVTFERALPATPEGVLAAMPKKARAEARKARERHGLELAQGVWYVDDLYRLFLRNKRQLGSPGMPPKLFRELIEEFGAAVEVHLVRRGKEALAAVMTFAYGGTLVAYYSGTAEGADRDYSASNFMYMALQEWGVAHGFQTFDFGRSRRDSGAMAFKKRQGFEPLELAYRYVLLRDRHVPSFTPSNPRTASIRKAWSRLPEWLVRRLSNRVARYVP